MPAAGGRFIPDVLTAHLPPARYAHTEDVIDFAALRGKTVGVIGGAAAAFDAAGVALEHGAAEVHLFARRDTIAAIPITRSRGFPGAYDNYHQLPDADRWHQAIRFFRAGSTPTTDAIERTVKFTNFHLHLSRTVDQRGGTRRKGRDDHQRHDISPGLRHRRHRLFRRSGVAAGIARFRRADLVLA